MSEKEEEINTKEEGWAYLSNSKKWHYFVDGRSLCGKWLCLSLSSLEQGNDESTDNCTACKKALLTRKANLLTEKLKKEGKITL